MDGTDTITARHIRTRVFAHEANSITHALARGGMVRDTAGMSKGAVRVADFITQHAAGGRYAALYPIPQVPGETTMTTPATRDVWQFTYPDGVVHGHIMLHHDISNQVFVCAMPVFLPRHELFGTTSRKPAHNPSEKRTNLLAFARYLFDRDNDAVRGWALPQQGVLDAVVDVGGAHDMSDMCVCVPLPGGDLYFVAGPGYLEADYVLHRKRRA